MEQLFFKEAEVWPGMEVLVYWKGESKPREDEYGLFSFRCLIGGVPMRKKFYPPEGIQYTPEGAILAHGYSGFRAEVRFVPKQIFLPNEAPPNTKFAVFNSYGEKNYYKDYSDKVIIVRTDQKGRILSHNGYAYKWWECEFLLPLDALLVPITKIGDYKYN